MVVGENISASPDVGWTVGLERLFRRDGLSRKLVMDGFAIISSRFDSSSESWLVLY